jgi:hypothetical protein
MVATSEERGLLSRVPGPRLARPAAPGHPITEPGQELLDRFRDEVTRPKSSLVAPLIPAEAEGARRYVTLCRAVLDSPPPLRRHGGSPSVRTSEPDPGPGRSGARGTPDRPAPQRSAVPVAPRLPEPADEPCRVEPGEPGGVPE